MNRLVNLESEEQTSAAGGKLAALVRDLDSESLVIYLVGDLGAGKTTLVRGFLRALGHAGRVPSPTYTLIEPYELAGYAVAHIDLYRLQHAGEATALALEELVTGRSLMLIEWPEKGVGEIPPADVQIELEIAGTGRTMRLSGLTAAGQALLSAK